MTLPFARSYWVVPGRFLAGCYPGELNPEAMTAKLRALAEAGVRTTVSLMEAEETDHSGHAFHDYVPGLAAAVEERGETLRAQRHPIVDGSIPSEAAMTAILDTIDDALANQPAVYVHCWGGRGRTGTVVACWLIRHGIASPETAVAHLQTLTAANRQAFEPTPENDRQRAFVQSWGAAGDAPSSKAGSNSESSANSPSAASRPGYLGPDRF